MRVRLLTAKFLTPLAAIVLSVVDSPLFGVGFLLCTEFAGCTLLIGYGPMVLVTVTISFTAPDLCSVLFDISRFAFF